MDANWYNNSVKYTSIIKPPQSRNMKAGRVVLHPGESVGEHVTEKREELIIVLRGSGVLIMNGKETILKTGETVYIGEGVRHDIKNNTVNVLEYVYVVSLF
jgi:quercetin dioxygenase-like cupin family protein